VVEGWEEVNITLGCWHLTGLAGTQSWAYTIAREFRAMGHSVSFYTGMIGEFAARLMGEGFEVYTHLRDELPKSDLSIIAQPRMFLVCPVCGFGPVYEGEPPFTIPKHLHRVTGQSCVDGGKPRSRLPTGKRVYVLHGWLPHDKPMLDGTPYVTISKETHDSLLASYKVESVVVRQPIDLARFHPAPPLPHEKPVVLSLATHPAEQMAVDEQIELAGCVPYPHLVAARAWDVERLINESDIVVGTGRGIAEALACGRSAVVCGKFGCDGRVTKDNIDALESVNYSGRLTMDPVDTLAKHLKACVLDIESNRALSTRFNARNVAEALLKASDA
jgi:hypothetical protein